MPAWRQTLAVAFVAATVAGCAGARPRPAPARPAGPSTAAYVESTRALLATPAELASMVAPSLAPKGALPDPTDALAVTSDAHRRLASLRAVAVVDPLLARQRRRVVRAMVPVVAIMDDVVRDVRAGSRSAARVDTRRLFRAMTRLPASIGLPPQRP